MSFSPIYVALVAFCFSMTIGVLWEFFEFGMDRLFMMDMQKDTIVHSITSVMLDPTNKNIPVTIGDITSVTVNGQELGFGGYLDIGLYDTMEDLFVNFIGGAGFQLHRVFLHQAARRGEDRQGIYSYHYRSGKGLGEGSGRARHCPLRRGRSSQITEGRGSASTKMAGALLLLRENNKGE